MFHKDSLCIQLCMWFHKNQHRRIKWNLKKVKVMTEAVCLRPTLIKQTQPGLSGSSLTHKESDAQSEEVSLTSTVTSGRGCEKFYQHIKVAGALLLLNQDVSGKCPRYLHRCNVRLRYALRQHNVNALPKRLQRQGRGGCTPSPLLTQLHVML